MKERTLIKVVATIITGIGNGRMKTELGRGIVPLKRGVSLLDFISAFLIERDVSATLVQREENLWATAPIMSLNTEPRQVMTFHFMTFPVSELGYYAKDLTKAELERDMKQLKRLING